MVIKKYIQFTYDIYNGNKKKFTSFCQMGDFTQHKPSLTCITLQITHPEFARVNKPNCFGH